MNDTLRLWLAPLIAEARERGIELSAELLIAANSEEGKLHSRMNWELFGQLIIERLGWQDSYPLTPSEAPERLTKRVTNS